MPANVGLVYVGAFPVISGFATVDIPGLLILGSLGIVGALELILKSDIATISFILFCNTLIAAYNTTKYSASSGKLAIVETSDTLTVGYVI